MTAISAIVGHFSPDFASLNYSMRRLQISKRYFWYGCIILFICVIFIPANLIFSASSGDIYTFWSIVRSKHEVASTTVVFVGSTVPNGTRGGIITT